MWGEIKSDWLTWWNGATWVRRILPFAMVIVFWGVLWKEEHLSVVWVLAGLCFILSYYASPKGREWFFFGLPYFLTAFFFHLLAPVWQNSYFPTRDFAGPERSLFGIKHEGDVLLPGEALNTVIDQLGKNWAWIWRSLEIFTGFMWLWFLVAALYFRFYLVKKKNRRYTTWGLTLLTPQLGWAFLAVSLFAYLLFIFVPVAPPWCTGFGDKMCGNFGGPREFTDLPWFLSGLNLDRPGLLPRFSAAISFRAAYATVLCFFAYTFGSLRTPATVLLLAVAFVEVQSETSYILSVVVGMVAAFFLCSFVSWVTHIRMKRATQLVWKPGQSFAKINKPQ